MAIDVPSTKVKLVTMENESVETTLKCAKMSTLIQEMCDNLKCEGDMLEIPVANVSTKTLKKIVEWMEKWQDTPQPSLEETKYKVEETIDPWNEEYLSIDLNDLYALVSQRKSIATFCS